MTIPLPGPPARPQPLVPAGLPHGNTPKVALVYAEIAVLNAVVSGDWVTAEQIATSTLVLEHGVGSMQSSMLSRLRRRGWIVTNPAADPVQYQRTPSGIAALDQLLAHARKDQP